MAYSEDWKKRKKATGVTTSDKATKSTTMMPGIEYDPTHTESGTGGGYDGTTPNYDDAVDATEPTTQTDTSDKTSYDYLREQSAADLLDAQVAADLRKTIASKNLSTDLSRLGLANSGYAGTASAMIGNAYGSEMAQAQADYDKAIRDYNVQELQDNEEASATFASDIVTGLGSQSASDAYNYLTNHGFTYDSESEKWVYNGEGVKLSDFMLSEINAAYKDILSGDKSAVVDNETGETVSAYSSKDDLKSALNTSIENRGEDLDYEVGYLFSNTANFSNGDVVVLINGKDPSKKAYVKNVNGAWVITTEDEYNKSSQKKQVKDGKYSDVSNADPKTQLQGNFDWEIDYLNENLGNYKEGDTVKLINGSDNSKVAYVKLVNGKWVVISSSEYTGSKSVSVSSGSGTKVTN